MNTGMMNTGMMKTIGRLSILLLAAALVAGIALAFSHSASAQNIAQGGRPAITQAQAPANGTSAAPQSFGDEGRPGRGGFERGFDGDRRGGGFAIGELLSPLLKIAAIVFVLVVAQRLYSLAAAKRTNYST